MTLVQFLVRELRSCKSHSQTKKNKIKCKCKHKQRKKCVCVCVQKHLRKNEEELTGASLVAQLVKNPPAVWET